GGDLRLRLAAGPRCDHPRARRDDPGTCAHRGAQGGAGGPVGAVPTAGWTTGQRRVTSSLGKELFRREFVISKGRFVKGAILASAVVVAAGGGAGPLPTAPADAP